jgi:hypothetical protein
MASIFSRSRTTRRDRGSAMLKQYSPAGSAGSKLEALTMPKLHRNEPVSIALQKKGGITQQALFRCYLFVCRYLQSLSDTSTICSSFSCSKPLFLNPRHDPMMRRQPPCPIGLPSMMSFWSDLFNSRGPAIKKADFSVMRLWLMSKYSIGHSLYFRPSDNSLLTESHVHRAPRGHKPIKHTCARARQRARTHTWMHAQSHMHAGTQAYTKVSARKHFESPKRRGRVDSIPGEKNKLVSCLALSWHFVSSRATFAHILHSSQNTNAVH